MILMPPTRKSQGKERRPKPYCDCWSIRGPIAWNNLNVCCCGEDNDVSEWKWQHPDANSPSLVVVSDDKKQVTFHPFYSSGTAVVKGDTPLQHNHHYYWEVKMLTETYGTDIMVGLGTNKVNLADSQFEFTSLLGKDGESYGLSYTGAVRHNATVARDTLGFCRGSIIGVMVDMWRGTLEFYLNRKPQGVSFYNLRRHQALYPMVCSTAAQSSMRLIYASSWRASLLVDAAKILAASVNRDAQLRIPPGIWYTLRSNFWLTLPHGGCILDEDEDGMEVGPTRNSNSVHLTPGHGRRTKQQANKQEGNKEAKQTKEQEESSGSDNEDIGIDSSAFVKVDMNDFDLNDCFAGGNRIVTFIARLP